jgi:kynurenine 3-monooxygenase
MEERQMSERTRSVLIVGGGPVGCALAVLLRRQGLEVDVYERTTATGGSGHSFNLTLTLRGLQCLPRSVQRRLYMQGAVLSRRIIHHRDGAISTQPYGTESSHHLLSIPRTVLQDVLHDQAVRAGARIHEGVTCVDVDAERPAALLHDPAGSHFWAAADLLVACDGANSAVRDALAGAHPDAVRVDREVIPHGHAEIDMDYGDADPTGMHLWPRGDHFLQAQPNRDRTFTTSLFKPLERDGGRHFAGLPSPGAAGEYVAAEFPDVADRMPDVGEDLTARRPGRLHIVTTAPYHHGRVVLVGDAAHAVVPFLGQGVNCSFEDAATLARLLEAARFGSREPSGAIAEAIVAEYSRRRVGAGHALADLSMRNLEELSANVSSTAFLSRKALERRLHELHPDLFTPLYQLVAFTDVPYDAARERYRVFSAALDEVSAGRDVQAERDAIVDEFAAAYGGRFSMAAGRAG